jgi:NAD(P)-dependent dehydrogenase (short-subunit alcohol dehydrogenase family)
MTVAVLEALRETGGRIVNVSSGAAVNAVEGWSAYCAAKAGLTHFTRVLAAEEPGITVVALRPGVVDTRMQGVIREQGPGNMAPDKTDYFRKLKEEGKLEPSAVPARSMAWLALHAPREWSGRFLEYDDDEIRSPAEEIFGEKIAR